MLHVTGCILGVEGLSFKVLGGVSIMFRDSFIAAIRTGVATVVGLALAYLVSRGFELDDSVRINLVTGLTVLLTATYNWLVINLEKRVDPRFGVLLGIPKAPSYSKTPIIK